MLIHQVSEFHTFYNVSIILINRYLMLSDKIQI